MAREKLYNAAELVQFPIKLLHGSVYKVHVRATNYAGLEAKFTTPLVIVDATAPTISYISDFGLPSETVDIVRGPDLDLIVHFEVFDEESGVEDAFVCLGSFAYQCDIMPAHSVEYQARRFVMPVTLLDGLRYYSTVGVKNAAGAETYQSSDGFVVDASYFFVALEPFPQCDRFPCLGGGTLGQLLQL